MTEKTLKNLVYTLISDKDIIILRRESYNKILCRGHWFQDWMLDHMGDKITEHFLRVETNKVIVWVK